MRLAPALAALFALCAPGFAEEEWVWPVPEISRDISALPAPAQATRQALIEAARSGDIEALRPIIEAQDYPPNVSFGDPEDAVAYLRSESEDGEGRQILGLLLDLLDQPYAFHPDSSGETYYIWPYLAELDPNALTPEQEVDAYRLLDRAGLEDVRQFGGWYYWRLFISETGEWSAFVAGD
ncbi:hypothetical protein [Devosia faecipullorum]|uniref:hypothetical protein n=1 Tax=Devosia faecipullorum TaxID=2755039 RepID=UPI00187B7382|nr:hypothetical protein [Devosia faecipullorum]MBE7733787.1 hypothetical protein [Devosia faecipullorum]